MNLFHHSYSSPQENLAIDEELLKCVNKGHHPGGLCRIWESDVYFVVLGLSKHISDDVHLGNCKADEIPILRRCSGGGTVLQGPGCFNYAFILPIHTHPELLSIGTTTRHALSLVQSAISPIISETKQQGISDLVINNMKFSGNAQRRLKHAILFHGTILYEFDIDLVSKYLKNPPIQPTYRQRRPHQTFIQNIQATRDQLVHAFEQMTKDPIPLPQISNETLSKYNNLSQVH